MMQKTENRRQKTEALSRLRRVLEKECRDAAHDTLSSVLCLLSSVDCHLTSDSRLVQAGDTFIACPGEKVDGRLYIAQAIAKGANAVIWDTGGFAWNPDWQIPNLGVSDLRHKSGWLADAIYGAPSEKLWMIGITGTNGKTSTSHWIAQALGDAGRKCALLGTLGYGFPGDLQPGANTTPDALRVHALLADYLSSGARAAAMEVSSHALAQGRVNGVHFDVALLTNLSRDHLDYHGDMQSYAACKRRLFDWETLKFTVINFDDEFGAELAGQLQEKQAEVVGYGLTDTALQLAERRGLRMVYGHLAQMDARGLRLDIHSSWGTAQINSTLVGRFNAENLLGTLAVLLASEISLNDAVRSLCGVQAVPGRMQRLGEAGQPTVIVDYAHTPDALEKVLLALRETLAGVASEPAGRLICVFGCGGERDRGKRPMMGLVAEKFSDHCIVTSDNPRGEDPQEIMAGILGGMTQGKHEIIPDRAAAIACAIKQARQGDTVLLAGKGHEDYQEIKGARHPFSDVAIAGLALNKWPEEVRP